MDKFYKGYRIYKICRITYGIENSKGEKLDLFCRYPKTIKEAKALIDELTNAE